MTWIKTQGPITSPGTPQRKGHRQHTDSKTTKKNNLWHLQDAHCQRQHSSSLCAIVNPEFISKKFSLFDFSPGWHGKNWQSPWEDSEDIFPARFWVIHNSERISTALCHLSSFQSSVAPSPQTAQDCQPQTLLSFQRLTLFPGLLRGKGIIPLSANKPSLWLIHVTDTHWPGIFLLRLPYAVLHKRHHIK